MPFDTVQFNSSSLTNSTGVMMKPLLAFVSFLILVFLPACAPSTQPTAPSPTGAPISTPPTANCPCLRAYAMPDAGVKLITDAIDSAQRSIKITMYLISEPALVDALRRAAARNVDVRLLVEPNPFGGGKTNQDVFNALKGTGIKWQWTDDNVYRFTHEKSMVIDEQLAYIMTHNFTTSSFNANREYGIIDTNPADVAEVMRVFEADWNHTKPNLSNARLVWSPVNARQKLLALIDEARTRLDMQQEEMQDQEIGTHLLNALRRGVQVRLVTSPGNSPTNDPNAKQIDDLRRAGAQVRYMRSPYVHAKMYLVDDKKAFVGSENNSANSLDNNRELGIIFDEADALKVISTAFEKDFAATALESAPVSNATLPPSNVVDWKDAAKYYGRTVTLEGKVLSTYNSGRVIWLILGPNSRTDAKVVIFPEDWPKFPQQPDKLYDGKTIRVTGLVREYQSAPEIIVKDPSVIVVVQ